MKTILSAIVLLFILSGCAKPDPVNQAPTFYLTIGSIEINGKQMQPDDKIHDGDRIVTGKDSSCEILFNTRNIIVISPESDVILHLDKLQKSIRITQGKLGYALADIKARGETFKVETDIAFAAVRGTAFVVNVLSPTNTYICACNGDIDTSDNQGQSTKELIASHHAAVRFIKDPAGKVTLTNAGMEYHSDEDMEHLASAIHYRIDWTQTNGLFPLKP